MVWQAKALPKAQFGRRKRYHMLGKLGHCPVWFGKRRRYRLLGKLGRCCMVVVAVGTVLRVIQPGTGHFGSLLWPFCCRLHTFVLSFSVVLHSRAFVFAFFQCFQCFQCFLPVLPVLSSSAHVLCLHLSDLHDGFGGLEFFPFYHRRLPPV